MIRPGNHPHVLAVNAARLRILEQLNRSGPVSMPELCREWPMARHHARLLVLDLSRDAMVSFLRSSRGGPHRLVITDAGRAALARATQDDP